MILVIRVDDFLDKLIYFNNRYVLYRANVNAISANHLCQIRATACVGFGFLVLLRSFYDLSVLAPVPKRKGKIVMKVEISINPKCSETHAVIYTARMTPEVRRILRLVQSDSPVVTGVYNGRTHILQLDDIMMVHVEKDRTFLHTAKRIYESGKRLYEWKNLLGGQFVQIAKSTLVNLAACDSLEHEGSGLALLRLKNGEETFISRHYLPAFKEQLDL